MQTYNTIREVMKQKQSEIASKQFDFLHPSTLRLAEEIAEDLLNTGATREDFEILELETTIDEIRPTFSDVIHLAVKYAKARTSLGVIPAFHTSVILPAYGENKRILPRGIEAGQDPDGEDFINEKHNQLEWLFKDSKSTYEVIIVDDMSKSDPVRSGEAAQKIIESKQLNKFKVLFLEDGVKNEKNGNDLVAHSLAGIKFPKNSKKAGSVYYGSAKAIQEYGGSLPHIIFATDCDLALSVVQLGNLVYPIFNKEGVASAASRRLPGSVIHLGSSRNLRANAARYFRKLMFKDLLPKDTQCGGKAFTAESLREILTERMITLDYSYDIELLTRLALKYGADKIKAVPVAWFDSAALTTTDDSVHFTIMKTQLRIAQELKLGNGPVFEHAVEISEILTSNNETWLAFLDRLKNHAELIDKLNTFETNILPELLKIAKA